MRELRLPAIRVRQGENRFVYSFAADGKDVVQFSSVSRLRNGGLENVIGYQRPEVLGHIGAIRDYLEGPSAILPNSIVLAFRSTVRFEPLCSSAEEEPLVHGHLILIWDQDAPSSSLPAWVVDGQQRLAAIREANLISFPICVTAFQSDDVDAQREQFILLNNTKPLPKSLIYELLPGTEGLLPEHLARKRIPALLARHLNHDPGSPFYGRIRLATNSQGMVNDNSIIRMIEHSLSDGALFRIQVENQTQEFNPKPLLAVLVAFWSAVRETWPDAWQLPPRQSRLLHGAGVISLGFVMDEICEVHGTGADLTVQTARQDLEQLRDVCFWTAGRWPFGDGRQRAWNEIQNTHPDINLLSNYLLRQYRIRVREAMLSGS
jgi:DGQHR domain-containing protein